LNSKLSQIYLRYFLHLLLELYSFAIHLNVSHQLIKTKSQRSNKIEFTHNLNMMAYVRESVVDIHTAARFTAYWEKMMYAITLSLRSNILFDIFFTPLTHLLELFKWTLIGSPTRCFVKPVNLNTTLLVNMKRSMMTSPIS
jgi:hypothetical protein